MKEVKQFKMGSSYFFNGIDGFTTKDNDVLILFDEWKINKTDILNFKDEKGNDVFLHKNMGKEDFIKSTLESGVPMRIGKFLIPEFAEYIGLSVEDLKELKPLIDKIDDKHSYERIIYDSYIQNNAFILNDEQRDKTYAEYKSKKESKQ